jgi:ABC-type multidrug transport system fused ATPase/permease subunit
MMPRRRQRQQRSSPRNSRYTHTHTHTSTSSLPAKHFFLTRNQAKDTFFTYFSLLFYADPTWLDYTLIILGTIVAAAAGTPFPLMGILFGQLVDDMNGATCANEQETTDPVAAQKTVNDKVLMLVYISAGALALIYAYFLMWSIVSQRLAHRLREKYFQSLLKQDAAFFDNRQAGEVSSRLNADISLIQSGTSEKVGIFIATISFFITAYAIGFVKYAKLAGILVSLVPAFLIMAIVCGGFVQKYSSKMSDGIASASSIASEALSHVAVVQAFGAGPRLEAKFAAHMREAHKQGIKKAVWTGTQAGLLYFIAYSANALAYWQGSKEIAKNVANPIAGSGVTVGAIYTVVFLIVDGEQFPFDSTPCICV